MGGQLWVSPTTGYRRRGTRLTEVRSLLGGSITAQAILEPLRSCPLDGPAVEAAAELDRLGFDVAGVQATSSGPVVGFVEQTALVRGTVREHTRQLTSDNLVSDSIPLPSLLSLLRGRSRAFVLVGSQVGGIVTRTDLNKPPVRVYLFGMVSLLEMHLNYWLRERFPEEAWSGHLTSSRVAAAERLQVLRKTRNQHADLFECLQLCDKREILTRDARLTAKLKLGDPSEAADRLKSAEALRDNLAHSQLELSLGSSWDDVIDLVGWIETAIQASDTLIEPEPTSVAAPSSEGE